MAYIDGKHGSWAIGIPFPFFVYLFVPSHPSGRWVRNTDTASEELLVYDRPAPLYPQSNFVPVPVKAGSCVLIHSQVVHRSDANRSDRSRHAYTFHVIETEDCDYSKENWLQPPEDHPFPVLYERD